MAKSPEKDRKPAVRPHQRREASVRNCLREVRCSQTHHGHRHPEHEELHAVPICRLIADSCLEQYIFGGTCPQGTTSRKVESWRFQPSGVPAHIRNPDRTERRYWRD
ncbi:hypothetical protein IscW_ISCW009260 [Ixodes scapularis]|uniref:Uncharacterized protein n=1 Tax=Ixodes scapularis TaxID=6945 RepID=B7PYW5_IXOSC|nr:hypothetical protein IscW_ISCW009260 [Ixodes scapularis]|eukprot:XP_002404106.1 hypothetical protein IscW_ISCW009260 [Ixodes scapularis]